MTAGPALDWVVLTVGNRPTELALAVESLQSDDASSDVVVVINAGPEVGAAVDLPTGARAVHAGSNLGVPGGRDLGVSSTSGDVIGFLDDDAVASPGASAHVRDAFDARPELGAVSLRLVDEAGETARRHVPRRGKSGPTESGDVALFLGGACAIRRSAYESVGGYFTDLHYGHEELELAWRLVDAGWSIAYLADVTVFHPRTDIARHADGWRLTGRNRVWIARRTLPWPVAIVHVTAWLALGVRRAPQGCRSAYLRGWRSGWRGHVDRAPISWRGVWRLTRLGRPPVF